jgi:hypothetical protein
LLEHEQEKLFSFKEDFDEEESNHLDAISELLPTMLRKRARLDEHTGFTSSPPKDSSEHRAGTSSSKDSTNDRVNKSNWPTIPEEVANPNNDEVLSGNAIMAL